MENRLPQKFITKMQNQLPQTEWEAFFAVYNDKPHKGARINPLKGTAEKIKPFLPFLEERIPWEENGYYVSVEKLGASPFHAAGLFYSQEPSAMSAAPLLDVCAGERVLDLCSAPGGKGTQLACKMQGKGIIVLNEPVLSRAKILSQNVERLGITNAVVTCETPEKLAERFEGYFDKILVDAPCSGEGMFRKNAEEALAEWSEENVTLCAERQARILREATKMLRVGGRMVYSTCTFAVEEDEGQISRYLQEFPCMRLCKQEKLYPHKIKGEGHFVALLEKSGITDDLTPISRVIKPIKPILGKESEREFRAFEKAFFGGKTFDRLHETNGTIYALPSDVFDWKGLQVLRVGVRLGEMKNGRFEPNHSLAMCVKAADCLNVVHLSQTDERVEKYLRGETFTVSSAQKNGWCIVCIEDFPLGFGKLVGEVVKNHLPKGLRKM